jgi:hypothetical protein
MGHQNTSFMARKQKRAEEAGVYSQGHVPNGLRIYYKSLCPKDVTTSQEPHSGTKLLIPGPLRDVKNPYYEHKFEGYNN